MKFKAKKAGEICVQPMSYSIWYGIGWFGYTKGIGVNNISTNARPVRLYRVGELGLHRYYETSGKQRECYHFERKRPLERLPQCLKHLST